MTIQDEAAALNKQAHRDECIQAMRLILKAKQDELKRHQQQMAVFELDMKELEDGVVPGRYQTNKNYVEYIGVDMAYPVGEKKATSYR